MLSMLNSCNLCPRNCNIDRNKGQHGFCKSGKNVKVARAALHHWEEPCLSGTQGSGTIFFSNCNLRCVFCQNHTISQHEVGKEISIERLSELFLEQQQRGAHNINLVTPTHYIPQIIEAIHLAKQNGLNLPIVYNSNGYENLSAIKALAGCIDIYLPDLKYYSDRYAIKYSSAPNYFKIASSAIEEMVSQVGLPQFDEKGMMVKGVIVRHLMLPSLLFDSKKILEYLLSTFEDRIYISLMNQYTPMHKATDFPEINKPLNPQMYESLIQYALSLGIKNGFIQEEGTVSESFVPEFDLKNI